ncbi:iron-containing alcohol dehydrogenase [Reichenbachiella versicolor]|uniref:iron-containing alcohol dehydrogenase n=1 Tax=Reichenbachiella versicolor TaxID=1821036 RepID=UPI000D6E7F5B|nr:iron-containing alcohol dehydrogenase [Reichenbachiella versicolor]
MKNFELYNPVNLVFGKNQITKLSSLISKDQKVLMLYGGGSIKKNGVYDQVKEALDGYDVVEFGGIEANPEFETLMKALKVIKEEKIDFMLAVGGGSVIDGTKFLSSAALYEGDDPWEILAKRIRTNKGLPFGTVLTLPATGSEMNSGAVVSRKEINKKLAMGGPGLFPQFSICDPTVVKSIPQRQIANGVADAFTHVLEQYMTYPIGALVQDRFSEGIMSSLIEVAPKITADPSDYDAAANFMWACTMALNGLIQKGVPTDWSVHMIAHEITAHYGVDHARTLAIVLPRAYQYKFEEKKEKLAQFAERVLDVKTGNIEEKASHAITAIEEFYHSLGIDTKLSEYTEDYEGFAQKAAESLTQQGMVKLGEHGDITPEVAVEILEKSY